MNIINNKRGEAVTLAVAVVAGVAILVGFLFRPIVDKVLPIFGGQQKQVTTQSVTVKPIMVNIDDGTKNGKWVVAQKIDENVNNFKGDERVTFLSWVKSLGFLWFIISLLSAGGVPIISVWYANFKRGMKNALLIAQNKIEELQESADDFTGEAKLIVQSVDNGLLSMDASIKAANASADATTDPVLKATQLAVAKALMDMKASFLYAMSKTQDSTTKKLVSALKND